MILTDIARKAEKFTIDNSPTILTAIGVTGAITTAYLTGKASFKAAKILETNDIMHHAIDPDSEGLPRSERLLLVWKLYIPAVGVGVMTVTCIIAANQIGARRAAAIAAAYTISEKAFLEYKEKVIEKLGDKQEVAMRDELAQDRVNANPPGTEVLIVGGGDVLFLDSLTGRYFQSTVESVKKAQNDTNYQILNSNYASLTDLYERLGLAQTPYSEEVGWNCDTQLEITFSTALTADNRPCIVLEYLFHPIRGYARLQ